MAHAHQHHHRCPEWTEADRVCSPRLHGAHDARSLIAWIARRRANGGPRFWLDMRGVLSCDHDFARTLVDELPYVVLKGEHGLVHLILGSNAGILPLISSYQRQIAPSARLAEHLPLVVTSSQAALPHIMAKVPPQDWPRACR